MLTSMSDVVLVAEQRQDEHPPEALAKNTVFLEAGGTAFAYALNYERWLTSYMAVRAGFGLLPIVKSPHAFVPGGISFFVGEGSHKLELGAGAVGVWKPQAKIVEETVDSGGIEVNAWWSASATIGYRYGNPKGGFVFRATFTPMVIFFDKVKFPIPWGGLSFGYGF
jgi:hypothetical protein